MGTPHGPLVKGGTIYMIRPYPLDLNWIRYLLGHIEAP